MEQWDVYDRERRRTGRIITRGENMAKGDYRLVIHVCIFNEQGKMLIQQRQDTKETFPGQWDLTVGGSALQGETSQDAAQRETREEIGLVIDLSEVRPHYTINFEQGFDDFYILDCSFSLDSLELQRDEVQAVAWASKEDIVSLIREKKFVPYTESFIQLLFDRMVFSESI